LVGLPCKRFAGNEKDRYELYTGHSRNEIHNGPKLPAPSRRIDGDCIFFGFGFCSKPPKNAGELSLWVCPAGITVIVPVSDPCFLFPTRSGGDTVVNVAKSGKEGSSFLQFVLFQSISFLRQTVCPQELVHHPPRNSNSVSYSCSCSSFYAD